MKADAAKDAAGLAHQCRSLHLCHLAPGRKEGGDSRLGLASLLGHSTNSGGVEQQVNSK
jgi:hypothetical protein